MYMHSLIFKSYDWSGQTASYNIKFAAMYINFMMSTRCQKYILNFDV